MQSEGFGLPNRADRQLCSISRALQGVGTTGVSVLAIIIITDVVPLTERGKYQGEPFGPQCRRLTISYRNILTGIVEAIVSIR